MDSTILGIIVGVVVGLIVLKFVKGVIKFVVLGIVPEPLLSLANQAATQLFVR